MDEKVFVLVACISLIVIIWLYRGAIAYVLTSVKNRITRKTAAMGCGLLLAIAGLSTFFSKLCGWFTRRNRRSAEIREESRRLERESQQIFERIKKEHHHNDELRDDLRANLSRMHDFVDKG